MNLSVVNEIESSKPYRLMRKLYYTPFARLDEYSKLAQAVMQDRNEVSERRNGVVRERDLICSF